MKFLHRHGPRIADAVLVLGVVLLFALFITHCK